MGDNYPHVFPGQRACGAAKRWEPASTHRGATNVVATIGDTFPGTNRRTDGHILTAYQHPNQSSVTADKHTHHRWVTAHKHTHNRGFTAHKHAHRYRVAAYKHAPRGVYRHDDCLAPDNSKSRGGADADSYGRGWPVGDWDPSTARCDGDPAAAKHSAGSNDEQLFYRR